jgi:hypothetical protein
MVVRAFAFDVYGLLVLGALFLRVVDFDGYGH